MVDEREAKAIQGRLDRWFSTGILRAVTSAGNQIKDRLLANWEQGKDAEGNQMEPVKDSTMGMPISYSQDMHIRRSVNPDQERVVYATGHTAKGHVVRKIPNGVEIINPDYQDQMKLQINASGRGGRTKRDPLVVGDNIEVLVNEMILDDFDRKVGI